MELDQLKGFYFVAKLGSFTEAAAKLYLTQPAISHQIKALEKAVGEPLLDRVGRTVRLTHTGSILYHQVEELLVKLDDLESALCELQSLGRGRLSIGASDTASIYFLPEVLTAFRDAHPRVELSITSLMSCQAVKKVMDRELDLGLITLFPLPAKLKVLPLFAERLACIVPHGHPSAAREFIGPDEIAGQPLILLERGSVIRQRVEEYLNAPARGCRPVMELSNFEVVKRYVAAGLGVSLAPEASVDACRDGVRMVPLQPDLRVAVGLIYRGDRKLSRAAQAFLALAEGFFARRNEGRGDRAMGLQEASGRPETLGPGRN
ncbi:MAG: LysR family transcriptional regulator [Planctomycetes bacterium]|nr:LysR family transcriptional regulator [Planctomycetota bacterium]